MNKAKLKSYAPQARKDFIQMIRQRADLLGLTKSTIESPNTSGEVAVIEGRPYPKRYAELHKRLVEKIKAEGLESLIERVAYSWFNRFAALRFMEVNNFLSHGFRILSNREAGKNEPEILTHADQIDLPELDKDKVLELKLAGNKDAELYKMLIVAQCNELNRAMPFLFERINDETEILLPDNLLASDSVIRKMVAAIDEADWAEVEIIGWLYQFYISEKKDEVIGKTVKSEDIPAATQLFTPNWIVKYMTQNSLGRLWCEANPHSQLAANMEFYIKPADENPTASSNSNINPEEIKVLDPACGSGHILVEAYELLKAIYTERGYSSRDIPLLILENNLFGLDIDERAAQMANFALLMKARRDDRRIFERLNQKSEKQIPNILTVPDSSQLPYDARGIAEMFFSRDASSANAAVPIRADGNFLFDEMQVQRSLVMSDSAAVAVGADSGASEQNVIDLLELFEQGKTLGSLIRIPHGFGAVVQKLEKAVETKLLSGNFYEQVAARELEPFVRAGRMLANKYDCVIANPPYMGRKFLNDSVKTFAKKNFPNTSSDLYSMFLERSLDFVKDNGFQSMITMQSWMFISSYEQFRRELLGNNTIINMMHTGAGAFEELNAFNVLTTACTIQKGYRHNYKSTFCKLNLIYDRKEKIKAFSNKDLYFTINVSELDKIPRLPIAYWVSEQTREAFQKGTPIGKIADVRVGLQTGNNNNFVRYWFEVNKNTIGFNLKNSYDAQTSNLKWFPYHKGGNFKKWFGNNEFIVNWQNNGFAIKNFVDEKGKQLSRPQNVEYYFKPGITWSLFGFENFGVKYKSFGYIFDVSAASAFPSEEDMLSVLAYLSSKVAFHFLSIIAPTVNFQAGDIAVLPYLRLSEEIEDKVKSLAQACIEISKGDWDSSETSWDFDSSPLLKFSKKDLTTVFSEFQSFTSAQLERLRNQYTG